MGDSLKIRLKAGKPLVGCFVMLPSAAVVEMVGYAGFDFVILDQEHGAAGVEMLENQIRAAEVSGASAIVRIPAATPWMVQQALDAGAEGLLVPHVAAVETAQSIVTAAHYPPHGIRGLATTSRSGRHGLVKVGPHLERSYRDTLVMLQIEDRQALPNVADIASLPGVDAIFIGPADLSISLGHPGDAGHPDVVKAIEGIVADTRRVGKAKLATFARAREDAEALRRKGEMQMICLSTTAIFSQSLRNLAEALVAS